MRIAKNGIWAPRVLSEGPSAPSVAPLAPFRDFWGSLGPPVSPLGAPRGLPKTASKIQNRFWEGPWGRQCTFNLGKSAFREKTKKSRCAQNLVRPSFSKASKIDFLADRGAPRARFKNSYRKKGASKSQNCEFGLSQTTFREKRLESIKIVTFGARRVPEERFKQKKLRGRKKRPRRRKDAFREHSWILGPPPEDHVEGGRYARRDSGAWVKPHSAP